MNNRNCNLSIPLFLFLSLSISLFSNFAMPKPICAQSCASVDYKRLILEHPIVKQYDKETGAFKGTKSEVRPIGIIALEIEELEAKISALRDKKNEVLIDSLQTSLFEQEQEKDLWSQIKKFDQEIEELESSYFEQLDLFHSDGKPSHDIIRNIIKSIVEETAQKLPDAELVLNKFPRYPSLPPDVKQTDSLMFFFRDPHKDSLLSYLEQAPTIAFLFKNSIEPILFQRGVNKK